MGLNNKKTTHYCVVFSFYLSELFVLILRVLNKSPHSSSRPHIGQNAITGASAQIIGITQFQSNIATHAFKQENAKSIATARGRQQDTCHIRDFRLFSSYCPVVCCNSFYYSFVLLFTYFARDPNLCSVHFFESARCK